mgnify:CR=1 FL=1
MNKSGRTSRVGIPLDIDAATERAAQAAVLSDPANLRILSDLAAGSSIAGLIAGSPAEPSEITRRLGMLLDAGLIHRIDSKDHELTADAWVRFGRLLVGAVPGEEERPSVPLAVLPPAVTTIIDDLSYRFHNIFAPETIARYVVESYLLLANRARVQAHLMSLTARYAADRLEALASVRGLRLHRSPEVLFVCVHNAGRSQMAGAFMRHFAGNRVHVRTAGSEPSDETHPRVVAAMEELGIPVWGEFPKPLTDEVVRAADYVVTMGCGDACPVFPGRRYLDWDLEDPLAFDDAGLRSVRDEIRERVVHLLDEMGQAERQ